VKIANQNQIAKAFRDQAMAEKVKWILDQEPPRTKMMLWAHHGHVAAEDENHLPVGAHRRIFGEQFHGWSGLRATAALFTWHGNPAITPQLGVGQGENAGPRGAG